MRSILTALLLLPAIADAQFVRTIVRTNDVLAIDADDQEAFFSGESVTYSLYPFAGTNAHYVVPTGSTATWIAVDATLTNTVFSVAGVVVHATNGPIVFTLPATSSVFAVRDDYRAAVILQLTNQVGVLDTFDLAIKWRPTLP